MKKTLISLVMFVILITTLVVPVYAAGAYITVSGGSGNPGETVTVYVSIVNNTVGFASGKVTLSYDSSAMQLVALNNVMFAGETNVGTGMANHYGGGDAVTGDGVLTAATFKIHDSAKKGDYTVSASLTGMRDHDGNPFGNSSASAVIQVTVPKCQTCSYNQTTKAPTCEETGLHTYVCSVCGDTYTESIPALGHAYGAGVVTTAPTCEGKGVKTYTCANDKSHVKTEEVAALGHAYGAGVVTTAPTCEGKGVKTYTCANDKSHVKTEDIDAIGHNYKLSGSKEATCTATGYKTYTCENDKGHTYTDTIPVKPHSLSAVAEVAADCENAGTKAHDKCSVCKKLFINGVEVKAADLVIDALGHKLEDVAEVPATCDKAGTKAHKKCSACGKTFIDGKEVKAEDLVIPSLHDQLKWQHDENKHWMECKDCGKKINEGAHTYGSDGYCTVCRYKQPGSNPNLDGQPDTGDIFVEIAVYASLAALAVGAVVFAKRKVRG